MRLVRLLALVSVAGVALAPRGVLAQLASPSTTAVPAPPLERARALAREALAHHDAGRFAESAAGFRKADGLYPAPQYRLYLARSLAKLDRVASAARSYEAAIAMPAPAEAPAGFREAQAAAVAELGELKRRVPAIQVVVTGPAGGAVVTLDGVPLGPEDLARLEVDPGAHTLAVKAAGFEADTRLVEAREAGFERVEVALKAVVAPAAVTPTAPVVPVVAGRAAASSGERDNKDAPGVTAPVSLSHRRQFGAVARADVDPLHGGAVFAPGATFGIVDWLEVGAMALVGRDKGLEPDLTFYMLRGAWKPLVNAGMPILFHDGPRVGVRGAGGVQWDPIRAPKNTPTIGKFRRVTARSRRYF